MSTKIKGGSSNSLSSDLLKGLTRKNPPVQDSSRVLPKSPSTAAEATRDGVAKTPKTLGPRTA